jgi:hypothetical protein
MNPIMKLFAPSVNTKKILEDADNLRITNTELATETMDAVVNALSPDSPIWDEVTQYRPECRENPCTKEQPKFNDDLIAGMTLDEFIERFPRIQYVVGQILDFVYKEEMIVTNLKNETITTKTEAIQKMLNSKDLTGISNGRKITDATKEALLYGRAGIFKQPSGDLVTYPHDRYTVVMGMRQRSETMKSEVLGYIIYADDFAPKDAVLDLENFQDFDLNDPTDPHYNNDWILQAIKRGNKITNFDDKMMYVPVGLKRFVNLRYDTEVQNPLSRLYYSRLEVENSAYFRDAMNRKFLEKGLGRLIIQLKDEVTGVASDDSLEQLINRNHNAKKDFLDSVKDFTKAFSNSLKNLNDDDFIISPSNIDNIERLENTNTPNLFLKLLDSDDTVLPAMYGIPASLLGLGTLSDRNISIANVNATAEDTTVREIRETFMSQLAVLFDITDDEILTSEKIVDKATQQEIAKTTAEVAELMYKIGMTAEAQDYVRENLNL